MVEIPPRFIKDLDVFLDAEEVVGAREAGAEACLVDALRQIQQPSNPSTEQPAEQLICDRETTNWPLVDWQLCISILKDDADNRSAPAFWW